MFMEFDDIVLKFTWKSKEPRRDMIILKNFTVRIFILAAMQTFLTLGEGSNAVQKQGQTERPRNRRENSGMDAFIYGNLAYGRFALQIKKQRKN